jgi:hypothetical protein
MRMPLGETEAVTVLRIGPELLNAGSEDYLIPGTEVLDLQNEEKFRAAEAEHKSGKPSAIQPPGNQGAQRQTASATEGWSKPGNTFIDRIPRW